MVFLFSKIKKIYDFGNMKSKLGTKKAEVEVVKKKLKLKNFL